VNCEKVFKTNKKKENFSSENINLQANKSFDENENNNFFIDYKYGKSASSYQLSCEKKRQFENEHCYESSEMRNNKSINFG
jgi:hypothetical protein